MRPDIALSIGFHRKPHPGALPMAHGQLRLHEAKAMLMKAVAAVKADKANALDMFNKGEGGFRDRDLYVFCVNLDGKEVAIGNPNTRKTLVGYYK